MATTVLNVPDISCEHCERTIVNALGPVSGVRDVVLPALESAAQRGEVRFVIVMRSFAGMTPGEVKVFSLAQQEEAMGWVAS